MHVDKLDFGKEAPDKVNVIIEIQKGSNNKYELDKESGAVFLDRVLHTSMYFPADYGHVPHTLADDGDPIDVLVLISNPTFPGCVIEAKPIGVINMTDEKGGDDKIIAVSTKDPNYKGLDDISQLPAGFIDQVVHFFEQYKALEKGKFVKVTGKGNAKVAKELIAKSIKAAKKK